MRAAQAGIRFDIDPVLAKPSQHLPPPTRTVGGGPGEGTSYTQQVRPHVASPSRAQARAYRLVCFPLSLSYLFVDMCAHTISCVSPSDRSIPVLHPPPPHSLSLTSAQNCASTSTPSNTVKRAERQDTGVAGRSGNDLDDGLQGGRIARVSRGEARELATEQDRVERLRRWERGARDEMESQWEKDVLERARAHLRTAVTHSASRDHATAGDPTVERQMGVGVEARAPRPLSRAGGANEVYVDLKADWRDGSEAGGVAAVEVARQRHRETKMNSDALDDHSLHLIPPQHRLRTVQLPLGHTRGPSRQQGDEGIGDGGDGGRGTFEVEHASTSAGRGGGKHGEVGTHALRYGCGARGDASGVGRAWEGAGDYSDSSWSTRSHATSYTMLARARTHTHTSRALCAICLLLALVRLFSPL